MALDGFSVVIDRVDFVAAQSYAESMSTPYSATQQSRVSNYRRRQAPDSVSDSQAPPGDDLYGTARPVPRQQSYGLPPAVAQPHLVGTPKQAFGPADHLQPAAPAAAAAAAPTDITSYIMQLEKQNVDIRAQVLDLQASSRAPTLERGEESKRAFLNDVLAQVESIIDAHRNKANAEIAKYKAEAEQAAMALKNLRQTIQSDGLDLAMAPAMIAFQRKQHAAGADAPPLGLSIPPDTERLLDGVATDLLATLLTVQGADDIGAVVRGAVKSAFEGIVVHFTDELCGNLDAQVAHVEALTAEIATARQESRTSQLAGEQQRVALATDHALELQALRDEMRAFQNAAGADEVTGAVHDKAFAEYAGLLVDARREAAHYAQELENEKNHSAAVCLKLKAALQQRNGDFEKAVLGRAEEVVAQKDRMITQLERRLREREASAAARQQQDAACQAGEPMVSVPTADTFVAQLVSSVHKDSRAAAQQQDLFERDVWQKTQELLGKYGQR
jgi:hypothetical protein